jgi:hypothetical protein
MRDGVIRGVLVAAAALAAVAAAAPMAEAGWRDPACEIDGGAATSLERCVPPLHAAEPSPAHSSCAGAVYCEMSYDELDAAGFDSADLRRHDGRASDAAGNALQARASGRLSYGGWVSFFNFKGKRCAGTVRDSGHCAWLFHEYRVFEGGDPRGGVHVTAYPARSGNDDPSDKWVRNVGPLPDRFRTKPGGRTRDHYRWGRMNGRFTGFESDGRESFYPGLWRLDPWVAYKPRSRYYRSSFEVHGGRNTDGSSRLWTTRTGGCIRLSIAGIRGLKGNWARRTDNKRRARLYVIHNP